MYYNVIYYNGAGRTDGDGVNEYLCGNGLPDRRQRGQTSHKVKLNLERRLGESYGSPLDASKTGPLVVVIFGVSNSGRLSAGNNYDDDVYNVTNYLYISLVFYTLNLPATLSISFVFY